MTEPFRITLIPDETTPPDRIDRWLATALSSSIDSPDGGDGASGIPPLSRSRLKALILDGQLEADGVRLDDPSASLIAGRTYTLTIPPAAEATPKGQDIPLDILFEDDHVIIINKPAGMVTHPAPGNPDGTLVNALIHHCGESLTGIGGEKRPGIVHRLDKDTSGVMMAAKTAEAHQRLTEMFAAHDLDRVYTALVWGVLRERVQTIDAPIGRSNRDRKKMAITANGREAITHVEVQRALPPLASLATCRLETGRTHQIRVHMASIGHGIIGDSAYGRPLRAGQMPDRPLREALEGLRRFPRQALHASLLGLDHPITGERLEFTSPLPADMACLIDDLAAAIEKRGHL
ncbi:MAG: RluA family pseudouridine synthase [Candidatus Puniceispirillales bacterium]